MHLAKLVGFSCDVLSYKIKTRQLKTTTRLVLCKMGSADEAIILSGW